MANNVKEKWSKNVMRVYQKYPAAFRSNDWPKIVAMANSDDVAGALLLAQEHEDEHKSNRAENVIARRVRIQRVALIKLQKEHLAKIKEVFETAALALANKMIHQPNNVSAIAPMRQATKAVIIDLRRALNVIITDLIWQSIILGVKNMGEAIKPILRDNQESFTEELADVALIEERLTLGLSKKLSSRSKGTVVMDSDKWQAILDGIYADIVKKNLTGLTLSERIWDLSNRAEMDLKRLIASDIASGESSRDIADKIQKYIFTQGVDDVQGGPGVYKSPLKNAMRLARTETNRAYTKAAAAWADNKPWVKGLRITLSPAHEVEDDCDDEVENQPDDGYPADEFSDHVPVHPHCMCFPTYVIDENHLTGGDNAAPADEEE